MDNFSDNMKPAEPEASPLANGLISTRSADSVISQEDCQRTSRPGEHPGYPKYPTMEEISAQLAAKLALMEASRQDLKSPELKLHLPKTSKIGHEFCDDADEVSSLRSFSKSINIPNTSYQSANPRFKTEICRNFKEKGTCLYGDLCQFAHGKHELRGDVVRHSKYKTKPCQKYWVAGYCAYGPRCNFVHQEVDRKTALQLLSEGVGKQLGPNLAQSIHDFRPRAPEAEDHIAHTLRFKELGYNTAALPTKNPKPSSSSFSKDSGFGDASQIIFGTSSPFGHPTSSSLADLAVPPLASSSGCEVAYYDDGHLGTNVHPKEVNPVPETRQLWDNNYLKERGLMEIGNSIDDVKSKRNTMTNADDANAAHLNKFRPDPMAVRAAMEMKLKTNPVAHQVTNMTSSSKALPINFGLFADFVIEDRSRFARHPIGSERSAWSSDPCK